MSSGKNAATALDGYLGVELVPRGASRWRQRRVFQSRTDVTARKRGTARHIELTLLNTNNTMNFSGTAEGPDAKLPPLLLSGPLMQQRQVNATYTMGVINNVLGTNFGR
jgi:hypothetical protein